MKNKRLEEVIILCLVIIGGIFLIRYAEIETENQKEQRQQEELKKDLSEYNYRLECKLIDFQFYRPGGTKYLDTLHHDHPITGLRSSTTDPLMTDYNLGTNSLVVSDRIGNKGTRYQIEREIIDEYNLIKNIKVNNEIGMPNHVVIKVYITDGNYNIVSQIAEYKDGVFLKNELSSISKK